MAFPLFDKIIEATASFTPDTSAYSANDVVGSHANATTGAMTFDISGTSSGAGLINKLLVYDDDNEGAAGALWLFTQDLATPILDNAGFSLVLADWDNWITTLTLPSFTTYNSIKQAVLPDINDTFKVTKNLIYGYFVCSGTPTYAGSKTIKFRLGILTQ